MISSLTRRSAALASLLASALLLSSGAAFAQVRGAGASFPSKVYEKWAATYAQQTGQSVQYKPTGSGDGVKQISARSVDFGGSDSPLSASDLTSRKLVQVQVPMLVGGIVPVVNLAGVTPNKLELTGEVLADIMAGRITQWNDARITALNASLKLPAKPIVRIVRGDRSGTTEGLTRYLAGASASFKSAPGISQAPAWPGEVVKAEGNDGMVKALQSAEGAIAYVSYDRVVKDKLAGVLLQNAAGRAVAASEAGFRAAILDSDVARKGDDVATLMDRPAPDAWPITMTSFVLFAQDPDDFERATQAARFLYWCFMHGDDLTRGTGFAPLPVTLQARLANRFASIKAKDGRVPAYATF